MPMEIHLDPPQQAPAAFSGRSASRRSSIDSQISTMSIEPLHDVDDTDMGGSEPGARMPRRRSSNISFEKHNSVVLEQLVSLLDDDDSDDEDSLDGIPTASEAPENPNEPSSTSQDLLLDFGNRSQASVDVNDMPVSVASFRRRRSSVSASAHASFNGSILGRIEDDIIEKSIRQGKLVPDEDTARIGHHSTSSLASSSSGPGARRRGSLGRRTSFSRRASTSSAQSGGSGRTRRISFTGSRGSFRAGSNLQRDIAAAVRDLDDEDLLEDDEDIPSGRSMNVEVEVEVAVPPPRGAMPRRSSMKSPESRRVWS